MAILYPLIGIKRINKEGELKMNDTKLKDLKRFWTWCGLAEQASGSWYTDDGEYVYAETPPLELNYIYRYAIPTLLKDGYTVELIATEECFTANIFYVDGRLSNATSESPAEAIFNAILKIINNEVKREQAKF
jgi:hypothetical protein